MSANDHISDIGNLPVIDHDRHDAILEGIGRFGRGRIERDLSKEPFGSNPACVPFDVKLIPRNEWAERIQEMERKKSRLTDLCDVMRVPVKNQQQTNYCWINAPVHCLEILRAIAGQKYVELSPASVGGPIKRYRNEGGWGTEGLRYIAEHGVVPVSLWPANAIDDQYDTAECQKARNRFQIQEWYELDANNFDQVMTCLFFGIPVAIGLSWWGHEVTAMAPVKLDGRDNFGIVIDNSWGIDWGEKGRSVLTENKATPNDAVAPFAAEAS